MKRRIFIVEDHPLVRESYIMFFNMTDDLEVCGSSSSAEEALEVLEEAKPDVLVVDVSLPGMSGIDLIETLQESHALLPTLVLTGHDNDVYRNGAADAGALCFKVKHDGPDEIVEAIRDMIKHAYSDTGSWKPTDS